MKRTIADLNLDMAKQVTSFRDRWVEAEVRVITLDGTDVGWLQTQVQADALFVAQLFVDAVFQGRGIGSEVMNRVIEEAAGVGRGVTLGVVKTNPALQFYSRLGFQVTGEDERKFYMRRMPDGEGEMPQFAAKQ